MLFNNVYVFLSANMFVFGCSKKPERHAHTRGVIENSSSPFTKLRSIPMQDTRLTDGFWAKRFELAVTQMLPTLEETMSGDRTANQNRIKYAAGLINDNNYGTPWDDGDSYKWIESMAHIYKHIYAVE